MQEQGLAPATINRRLAAVRSLVKLARMLGRISWCLDVEGLRRVAYRDTRGPGLKGLRAMLACLKDRPDTPKARRDLAIFRLMADLGLRRGEIVSLDPEHLDLAGERLWVLGKGHEERVAVTLPRLTRSALERWLEVRNPTFRALFYALDNRHPGHRLTGGSLWRMVVDLGEAAGVGRVWPHALRHAAITQGLDATGGNVRDVRRFSRHADMGTLMHYDDARDDAGGRVADLVAASIGE